MLKSERFEKIYKDLQETPTGALNEDLTDVTMSQQFNDSFIRNVAKHLVELEYNKSSDIAREIFEKIDKLAYRYLNDADYSGGDLIYELAELKKKYTESEDTE